MNQRNDALRLGPELFGWWKRQRSQTGLFHAIISLARVLWDFALDSLPERRKQRYGDADYDWDFHVNTTSGTVGWRDRFLGLLHSPYQPTEPALFHEMLERLILEARINVEQFTFVDVGSGKGRTLLMASDYPFQRIVGVELLPSLHQAAQQNIAAYRSEKQKCFAVESVCADASDFEFPPCAMIVYLFNPLPQHALIRMLGNLQASLEGNSNFKDCFLLYHNPLLEQCLIGTPWLEKIFGTQQFAVYRSRQSRDSYHQNR